MAAMEVICSVHQHEVCMLHCTQPRGHKDCHLLCKCESGGSAVTKVTKTYFILHPRTWVCVCMCISLPLLSRVLWYVFMVHRRKTSLQSSGEGHKLPISTGEGPLFIGTSLCTHDLAWTHPLVRKCEQIHLLYFFPWVSSLHPPSLLPPALPLPPHLPPPLSLLASVWTQPSSTV